MAANLPQIFNFIQGSDINGVSSYDIWKSLNPNGTESEFLEYLRSGPPGEKGADGESALVYFLEASENVMKKGADNLLLPKNITFRSFYRVGASATRFEYLARFIIQETIDGVYWTTKYISNVDESSVVYTPSSSDVKIIKCRAFVAGDTTTELDSQTVVILTDVSNIEVGTRNLLSNSDICYRVTRDSYTLIKPINIVKGFDLQRLVGKKVVLSFYVDNMGDYTNTDDGTLETSNKFGMQSTLVWSDSKGTNPYKVIENPISLSYVGINKDRVSGTYELVPPEGYDTIESFDFEIQLTLKPTEDDVVWVFSRPKLEFGTIATDYSLAPEDIETLLVVLNNEAHVIATDIDGDNGNYEGCNTQVKVYIGTNEVTDDATYEITTSQGLTGIWDEDAHAYTVTDLSTDAGYVDIKATYNNIEFTKRFSVSKAKSGIKGESAYETWKGLGYEGSTQDFIEFLKGEPGKDGQQGADGQPGQDGKSAYEVWLEQEGNAGKTEAEFLNSLKGLRGESTYDIWKGLGNEGTANDFLESLKGDQGKSNYDLWLELGNEGTAQDFLDYLQGPQGKSNYDLWIELGNEGDANDFLNFLKGGIGEDGKSAYQVWLEQDGNAGKTVEDFLNSLRGQSTYDVWKSLGNEGTAQEFLEYLQGPQGESAYQVWLKQEGNEGKTEAEFLNSLRGQSTYDVWKSLGNTGTAEDFLNFLKGVQGDAGKSAFEVWLEQEGNAGKTEEDFFTEMQGESTYDVWKGLGNEGDAQDFLDSLKGDQGESTYDVWKGLGYEGDAQDFLDSLKGPQGDSNYDLWKSLGYEGTPEDFLNFLRGPQGDSNYDIWKDLGYEGTPEDFLNFLKGKTAYEYAKDGGFTGTESEFAEILAKTNTPEVDHIILKSSTEGSSKKFKLTIDDSGTLNVAEIV